jgi:hypothetical protein
MNDHRTFLPYVGLVMPWLVWLHCCWTTSCQSDSGTAIETGSDYPVLRDAFGTSSAKGILLKRSAINRARCLRAFVLSYFGVTLA